MAEREPAISRRPIVLQRGLLGCGIIAPVADVALIAFFASLHPDYDHVRQLMSELGEEGRPYTTLVNGWFSVASLLLAGFGIGLAVSLPRGRAALAAAGLYIAWATLGVVIAFFPCDPGCRGETLSARLHLALGGLAAVCVLPVPTLVWIAVRREANWRRHGWFAAAAQVLAICFTIASAAAAYEAYVVDQPLRQWAGLFQRLTWAVIYAWTIVMAITLLRDRRS